MIRARRYDAAAGAWESATAALSSDAGGRLSKQRTLAAGRYRMTIVATDAEAQRSQPARATFRLQD